MWATEIAAAAAAAAAVATCSDGKDLLESIRIDLHRRIEDI